MSGMPYVLADDWFEEKLNLVSISFQRKIMVKSKESKRTTPKRRTCLPHALQHVAQRKRRTDRESRRILRRQKEKPSGRSRLPRDDDAGATITLSVLAARSGTDFSTSDIPSFLHDVIRRVRQHQSLESIVKLIRTGQAEWTP